MPSPFPGMDPYIEDQRWKGFHTRFITVLGDALTAQLRPRYIVDLEEYVYVLRDEEESERRVEPDLYVAEGDLAGTSSPSLAAVTLVPVIRTLPAPNRHRQHYLSIRSRKQEDVVTVVELLSPTNKGVGYEQYLSKRDAVLAARSNLVEYDLLRGGDRLPTVEPIPQGDYFGFVCRSSHRSKVEVYSWSLRDSLPLLPIPLTNGDPDAVLCLQEAFTQAYERAGYDYIIRYDEPVEPPLSSADQAWADQILANRARSSR